MSRYKPVGWRHESHRHYLAAKGIKTRNSYFSPLRYRLPPTTLMEKLTPEQQEEAKRLLALGELKTTQDVADHFRVKWKWVNPQAAAERSEENSRRMSTDQKLNLIRKIGKAKGRLPTSSDLEEHGINASYFSSLGGFKAAVNKVVDEEAEQAVLDKRNFFDVADEWWFEKKKQRRPEETLEERYEGLIPEKVKVERAEEKERVKKVLQKKVEEAEKKKKLVTQTEVLKKQIKKLDEEISDLEEGYFNRSIKVSPGILVALQKQIADKKSERRDLDNELGRVKEELGPGFFARKNGYFNAEHMKWLEADSDEPLDEYIMENVVRKEHGGWPAFRDELKKDFQHPMNDLDDDWERYTSLADNDVYGPVGKSEKLSKDRVERAEQRGAANMARILSQANVEPLLDHGRESTARDLAVDLVFGRTDQPRVKFKDLRRKRK